VLLGEASHGTSEFYSWRTEITKRLISEQKFSFIAVEGDWPDCYNVNRYVKGISKSEGNDNGNSSSSSSAYDVLFAFNRWPTWMWANREIVDLIEWLRKYNEKLPEEQKVGFYGLDVYSLWESMESVIKYLKRLDPDAIKTALEAYRCFEPYERSVEDYARATAFVPESCEDEVIDMLIDLRSKASEYKTDGLSRREEYFNAEQNAVVAKNAELYYRKMIQGGTATWNIRDTHMMDTLKRLMDFYDGKYVNRSNNKNVNNNLYSKSIVWAHNTHVGDARQTDMAAAQMINIGELVREHASEQNVMIVGFGTYKGSVIAAKEWGEKMEKMNVPPAIEGSWDNLIHKRTNGTNSIIMFRGESDQRNKAEEVFALDSKERIKDNNIKGKKGQRAIGVVYNPEYEKYGNYVPTILTKRYDAFLYIDETHALSPLHMPETQDEKELPETFPTGL
jgi:erythromycin esterase